MHIKIVAFEKFLENLENITSFKSPLKILVLHIKTLTDFEIIKFVNRFCKSRNQKGE